MNLRTQALIAIDHALRNARDRVGDVLWPIQDRLPDGAIIGSMPRYRGPLTYTQRLSILVEWVMRKLYGALDRAWWSLPDVPEPEPLAMVGVEGDVRDFVRACIKGREGSKIGSTSLYEEYCCWCDRTMRDPVALPTFGRKLAQFGFDKERVNGRVVYIGIAWKVAEITSA